ncbi:hypothetical protein HK098_006766 [Nowakowskiella sp. JEL0407]|nr:hypothetical protein HK098_006766 [Nowakowskiella sp. JEL0407]
MQSFEKIDISNSRSGDITSSISDYVNLDVESDPAPWISHKSSQNKIRKTKQKKGDLDSRSEFNASETAVDWPGENIHIRELMMIITKIKSLKREVFSFASKFAINNDPNLNSEDTTSTPESLQFQKQVKNFKVDVENFNKLGKEANSSSLGDIRRKMEKIESDLLILKKNEAEIREELDRSENRLSQEIFGIQSRVRALENNNFVAEVREFKKAPISTNKINNIKVFEEVQTFQDFLVKNGGHSGGWDDYSHAKFVQLWKKYSKNEDRLAEQCILQIPGVSVSQAYNHIKWYEKYFSLQTLKTEAIKFWKIQKDRVSKELTKNRQEVSPETKPNAEDRGKMQQQRLKIKEEIKKWKELKEEKKAKLEAEMKVDQQFKTKEKSCISRSQENSVKKLQLQQYLEEKKLRHEAEKIAKEEIIVLKRKIHNQLGRTEIERLQRQDEELMRRRKLRDVEKQIEKHRREQRIANAKTQVVVSPDPERLFRLTKSVISKIEAAKNEDNRCCDLVNSLNLPKRHEHSFDPLFEF